MCTRGVKRAHWRRCEARRGDAPVGTEPPERSHLDEAVGQQHAVAAAAEAHAPRAVQRVDEVAARNAAVTLVTGAVVVAAAAAVLVEVDRGTAAA